MRCYSFSFFTLCKLLWEYFYSPRTAQVGVLSPIHLTHISLADFLTDFVMANGRADHTIPPHCAMQLRSMLILKAIKMAV